MPNQTLLLLWDGRSSDFWVALQRPGLVSIHVDTREMQLMHTHSGSTLVDWLIDKKRFETGMKNTIPGTQIAYCSNCNRRSSPVDYANHGNCRSIVHRAFKQFPGEEQAKQFMS